jgi:cell division protein FtsI/penicillin-binding protein 2
MGQVVNPKLWDVSWDQWEHRTEVVHQKETLVTQVEAEQLKGWIREVIWTGRALVLLGDQ